MTDDVTAVPAPTPEPGSAADQLARREAGLQALARSTVPAGPSGPARVLTDQFLLYTSWDTGSALFEVLPEEIGGLVLRGARAAAGIATLRDDGFDRPLLLDPEGYAHAYATEDEPFVVDPAGRDSLFWRTLEQELEIQRRCGASVVLTPTGYLRAGDSDALRAAVGAAARLEGEDVVFSAPLDVAWFTDDNVGHLIAVLAGLPLPKAVFLGGQFDPLKRYVPAVANLRRVVAEAGQVAVLRTDLTAFDVMAHGAFATSIGTGGSLRHMVPCGQRPRSHKKDPSPSVLFPELQAFHKGSTLQKRFADFTAPSCGCRSCEGRRLDTFLGQVDSTAAHRHNMLTWSSWILDLRAQATLGERATWWRTRCAGAVAQAKIFNSQIKQPEAFNAPATLRAWAQLPPWPSTEDAAHRPRTARRRSSHR